MPTVADGARITVGTAILDGERMRAPEKTAANPALTAAHSRLSQAVQKRVPSPERTELLLLLKAPEKLSQNKERILALCETLDLYAEQVLTEEDLADAAQDVFGQKAEVDPWAA